MAEQQANSGPNPQQTQGEGWRDKIGPLPVWGWLLIGVAVLGGIYLWQRSRNSSSNSSSSTNTSAETSASQIPQFVNQTYTSVVPPEASNPGPNLPAGYPKALQKELDSRYVSKAQLAAYEKSLQAELDKRYEPRPQPNHGPGPRQDTRPRVKLPVQPK